tara:strand:+ start:176 stop:400 length:225 start_codon:yes stop_codon:yes gene_type:complete
MDNKEYICCIALKKDLLLIKKSLEDYFKTKKLVSRISKADKQLAEAHSLILKQLTYNGILTRIQDKELIKIETI